ncbi:MAG: TIGR04190 family B12-binding domain/radical SAM domain protein, partial [Chloroflexota bacterium]
MSRKPLDLVLLHAPSVYDFRKKAIMYGPISDMIPSSPVFEMYPIGFLTLTAYLEARGLRVRIVNLALRMMNDPKFDVPKFLAGLNTKAFGIDLHWLPHAHGSLEVAKLCKEIHPQVPVIFGGLSATYFHNELIQYSQVDYVLRGDSTEPSTHKLLTAIGQGDSLAQIPNLTWMVEDEIQENPFTYIPTSLDYVDIMPNRLVRMVLRHRDLQSVIPFNGWWKNPITAVLTAKGCAHGCVTCGGSNSSCELISKRDHPIFRSPENLVKNIKDISRLSRGPIFLVGDLRQTADEYGVQVLEILSTANIKNEIVFEFFGMPPSEFLQAIDRSVKNWSIELSPESHDSAVRHVQDDAVFYTNQEMENVIQEAMTLRCNRVDMFFMIGLPQQTTESVMQTIDYCEHIFEISDQRVSCFISPMGHFLDPGSRGFEEPEKYGYRL